MKILFKGILPLVTAIVLLSSCGDMTKKLDDKLNELSVKAEQLDSLVNREVDRVLTLDTLVNFENEKINRLDSLINKTTSRIDSLASEEIELLRKIVEQ